MYTAGSISFRIWMAAIVANTLIGTAWLTGFTTPKAVACLFFGFIGTALFSLPVYLVIGSLISKLRKSGVIGVWALFWIYAVGLASTLVVHCVLMFFMMDDFFSTERHLLQVNFLAAIIGISFQAHRILNISAVEPE